MHTSVGWFFDFQMNMRMEFSNFKNLFGTSKAILSTFLI
jgi:hypothetical protein